MFSLKTLLLVSDKSGYHIIMFFFLCKEIRWGYSIEVPQEVFLMSTNNKKMPYLEL